MKTCYVFACGPSIKDQDLKKIKDNPCVTISNFFVHPEFQNMNVKYHIFGHLHHPITYEMGVAWFKECETCLNKKTKVLIHIKDKHIVTNNNLFVNNEVIYWDNDGQFPETIPNRMGHYETIAQIGLQMGYYVAKQESIDQVLVMGIDHSWVNHVGETKHFYDESQSVLSRMGYNEWFWFTGRGGVCNDSDLEREKIILNQMNNSYREYGELCEKRGVSVYNGTPNSLITGLKFFKNTVQ